jgi:two-component system NtrC family sensor kinase
MLGVGTRKRCSEVGVRLSLKIAFVIAAVATLIVGALSWFSIERECLIIEADLARDARLVGESLAAMLGEAASSSGSIEALLQAVDREEEELSIRWHDTLEIDAGPFAPRLASTIRRGEHVSYQDHDDHGQAWTHALVPVVRDGETIGALQVSESLKPRDDFAMRALGFAALKMLFVLLMSAGVGLLCGRWLVGQRVERLIELSTLVADGELLVHADIGGGDELAELGVALNRMCDLLAINRNRARKENEARLEAEVRMRHAQRLTTVGQLAAGVAHELGTPLNVISGRASLIMRRHEDDADAEDARIVRSQAARITEIVRRLLDFSRRNPPQRARADLGEIAKEALSMLASTAHMAGVVIELEVASDGALEGFVDRQQLIQVVTNLALNGIQASDEGGTLRVRASRELCSQHLDGRPADGEREVHLHIQVEDHGRGMTSEEQVRIFDPFFTTKEPGQGTGLGLSVVHAVLQEHGGKVTVRSELGQGSCFIIHLGVCEPA